MADNEQQSTSLMQPVGSRANLKQLLELNKDAIAEVIPAYLTAEKMLKVVMLSAMSNPDIFECTKESILKAVMVSAQVGIPIGPQSGHLVAFNNKVKARGNVPEHWVKTAQFIPDYRGLIAQAKRCGAITKAEAHLVYEEDTFEIDWGNEEKPLTHKPNYTSKKREAANVVAAYFRVKLPDGDYQYEVMTKAELDAIKARSKAKEYGPWVTDTGQMYRKTVAKRGLNYIPNLDDNVIMAIQHDNATDAGQTIDVVGLLTDITPEGSQTTTPAQTSAPTSSGQPNGETKSKLEKVADKVADAKTRQTASTSKPAAETKKPEPAKAAPAKQEPAKQPPATSEPVTEGETPPWLNEETTEQASATTSEPELESKVSELAAELADDGLTGEPVVRVKPKNAEIHGIPLPEFCDIVSYDETPSEAQLAALQESFDSLCAALGTSKSLDGTVKNFIGQELATINAATVEALPRVFDVIKAKRTAK